MTEKNPVPKLTPAQEPPSPDDTTTVDGAPISDSENPERNPDSEPRVINPYAYSVLTVPPNLRQEMLRAKLPRLAPEFFLDTVPPNQALEAPPPPSDKAVASAPTAVRRRPPVGVVIACLLGAGLLLALAIVHSVGQTTDQPAPAPKPAQPAAPLAPTVAHAAPAVIAQTSSAPPATMQGDAKAIVKADPAPAPSSAPAKIKVISKSPHPALTSPPPSSAAPVQPSWVIPR